MDKNNIRVGVFGCWRGRAYMKPLKLIDGVTLTAVCDKKEDRLEKSKEYFTDCEPALYTDFDEFINSGKFDVLFLCNYFNEHAQYAIKAMQHGIHVFSENMAASTMKLCVDLVRTVEETGCIYMMAENYCYTRGIKDMKKIYEGGTLGKAMFCEGEYVHPMSPADNEKYNDPAVHGEYHWRRYLPVTYYCSHAIGPLMYITGAIPKKVIGKAVLDTPAHAKLYKRVRSDLVGVMLVEMSDGSVYRVNGSSYVAPHANWYRMSCVDGAVETMRNNEANVRVNYNEWCVPEGEEKEKIYEAQWDSNAEEADKCGHAGSDYWVVRRFIEAVRDNDRSKLFPNVYQATSMSAISILGWRSVLHKSKELTVPDFRRESDRKKWENDTENPFPSDDAPNNIPYSTIPIEKLLKKRK